MARVDPLYLSISADSVKVTSRHELGVEDTCGRGWFAAENKGFYSREPEFTFFVVFVCASVCVSVYKLQIVYGANVS